MNSQLAHGPASGMFSLPTPQYLATLNALERQTPAGSMQLQSSSQLLLLLDNHYFYTWETQGFDANQS